MATEVTLRPMSEDEYTTWRAVCVAAYARDTATTLRITADVATERAAAQIEQARTCAGTSAPFVTTPAHAAFGWAFLSVRCIRNQRHALAV